MDRLRKYAPLSGLVFVVLFTIANVLWALGQPSIGADPKEIVDFYRDTSTRILIGGSLSLVSLVFLAWFGSVLRSALAQAEAPRSTDLPLTAFAGILLTCGVGLAAETINMVGAVRADDDGGLTSAAAQIYLDVSSAFGYWAAGTAFSVAMASTAIVALRTGRFLPRWASWGSLGVAVILLTPVLITPAGRFLFALPLAFLVAVSLSIYRQRSG